MPIKHCY